MNEHDYPPSPSYYQQNGADCRNHVTPEYWRDSAFVHLFRAGRKSGETVAEALTNAFLCLALWFRSQELAVPYYSAELARLRGELAALRSDGAPLESTPPTPTDPLAELLTIETDRQLNDWFNAYRGRGRAIPYTIRIESHLHNGVLVPVTWNIHGQRPGLSARDAARALHRILTGGAA